MKTIKFFSHVITTLCLVVVILFVAISCDNSENQPETCNVDNPLTDLPWLKAFIDECEKDAAAGYPPHARIYQCTYRDGVGFLLDICVDCPDAGLWLRSCDGESLCIFGGLAGNTCPEFNIDFENKKLIWETLTPIPIAQGNLFGGGREGIAKQDMVITTQLEWDNLVQAMNSINRYEELKQNIDFSAYQILAVFEEVKGNGGWSIDITDVTEYADSILVTINNLKKGDETLVRTQPYHITKIPVSAKRIVFKHQLIEDK